MRASGPQRYRPSGLHLKSRTIWSIAGTWGMERSSMFRARDPQSSLFSISHLLPEEKRQRLERDWPGQFRRSALPLIDEEMFRDLYHPDNGRPNKPVQTVVGVLILKDMNDFTDAEALGALEYDLRWHVALDLEPEGAHCCQKTLHNFRAKLLESERAGRLFRETTDRILVALRIDTSRQRLDSTHILSNIRQLSRLGLFSETTRVFLRELRTHAETKLMNVPDGLRRRYLKDDMSDSLYGDARASEARRRVAVCARDAWRLLDRFRSDEAVKELNSYGLLQRLFDEQCAIAEEQAPLSDDADLAEGPAPVALKKPRDMASDRLQSPHDTDVRYGYKGCGYEVQIGETCSNDDRPEMITYAEVTQSNGSDDGVTIPALESLAERGIQPAELLADAAYGSSANVAACEKKGTELVSPVRGSKPKEKAVDDTAAGSRILKASFHIDPDGERATRCPAGYEAVAERRGSESGRVHATFAAGSCEACGLRDRCPTKRRRDGRRVLNTTVFGPLVERRRLYENTEEYKRRYARRAGIEGTNSELKRAHGLGRLRVRQRRRVQLAVHLKALACNVKRLVKYLVRRLPDAARSTDAGTQAAPAAA